MPMPLLESFLRVQKENRTVRWYAMSAVYRSELRIKAYLEKHKVECFVPLVEKEQTRKGRPKEVCRVPAIGNLIFVHSSVDCIQRLKSSEPYLQYKISRRRGDQYGKKIWVDDVQMQNFISFCELPVEKRFDEEQEEEQGLQLPLAKPGQKVLILKKDGSSIHGTLLQFRGRKHKEICVQAGRYKAFAKLEDCEDFQIVEE